jgi:hypothetical protein
MTDFALNLSRRSFSSLKLLGQSFVAQWLLFVIPALYLLTNYILFQRLPTHGTAPILGLFTDLLTFSLPAGLVVMLVVRLVQYAVYIKPESPARELAREIADLFRHPSNIINGIPVFVAMVAYNKAMIELKPQIPNINPFKWDTTLAALDRSIHFGVDPWRILQPVMGYDMVTFLTNLAYDFWFLALFGSWIWFGFQRQASVLRTRFFFSYMLIWWIGGGLLAVYFSSAGPVYYAKIGLSPDPFADLMTYLHDVNTRLPIWSLDTQDLLWNGYTGKGDPFGISAFPSMHNGSAILFALAFAKVSRGMGRFFALYAVIILLGSVHLAWHYALDGYAAIALGFLCWWISEPIAEFVHRQETMKKFNENLAAL